MPQYSTTVICHEEVGTVSETYNDVRGTMSASVTLRCAWSQRHNLCADICGNRREWPGGAAGLVPRAATASIVPAANEVQGGSDPTYALTYSEALVTVNYTTEIVDVYSESIEPYAEFVTLDHRLFRWGSGSGTWVREEEAPGKLIRGINFVRSEYLVTSIDPELLSKIGHVNDSALVPDIMTWMTFPEETLLYAPPAITYKKDSGGAVKYDLTKRFTFNPNGWNKYYRPAVDAYQFLYVAGSESPHRSYPTTSLGSLFNSPE